MNELEKARQDIDEIDAQIAQLYEKRLDAVSHVLHYKKENHLPILDRSREDVVIEKNINRIQNEVYKEPYRDFITMMMRNSRAYQQSLLSTDIIAYSGVKGAFGQLMTEQLFPGHPTMNFESFDEVFQAVVDRKAHYGVIPFENTNSGSVGEALDGLLKYPVHVIEMADLQVNQCLLGMPGASLKDIEWVYSKDEALQQAKPFFIAIACSNGIVSQYSTRCAIHC